LETKPRISNVRTARAATQSRRKKSSQQRYAHLGRFVLGLAAVVVLLMGYVMMMANLTSLNYAVARAEHERVALQDQTARLDDRIAALRSQERLAGIAGKLGMHDAQAYAIVQLPQKPHAAAGPRLAVLSTLSGWLGTTR
ncbi:MAG: hypothetical protein M3N19_08050, partial [Candidatus Eremiobacteraeota bacterium]|nr:hypothetical protein [Candidatus Eremiobacteraeota bacterium]